MASVLTGATATGCSNRHGAAFGSNWIFGPTKAGSVADPPRNGRIVWVGVIRHQRCRSRPTSTCARTLLRGVCVLSRRLRTHLEKLTTNTGARRLYDRLGFTEFPIPDPETLTVLVRDTSPLH